MKRHVVVVLVFGMLPSAYLYAQQTTSTTLRVSARVEAVCEITASDLSFGDYAMQSARPLLGTTHLRATCTPNTRYQVALNQGTSPGTNTVTGVGTGMTQDHTVFGAIPDSQVVPAAEYSGPITVRIYY